MPTKMNAGDSVEGGIFRFGREKVEDLPQAIISVPWPEPERELPEWALWLLTVGVWALIIIVGVIIARG